MKTTNEINYEAIERKNDEPVCISDSVLVDKCRKEEGSYTRINFNNCHVPFKTRSCDAIHLDKKGSWIYSPDVFKCLVDNANTGICIVHDNLQHAYVNKKYCEITGFSDAELKKIKMLELISTEERTDFNKKYQLSFDEKIGVNKNFVATVIRKDGKRRSIEWSGSRLVWKGKPAIQGIARDITEYLNREKVIIETNKLLNNRIEDINAKLLSSSEKLEQKQSELICHKMELESVNKELLQTNRAMSVLARNIDKKKKEVEQKIAHCVLTKIIPLIDELKKKRSIQKYLAELEVLSVYVNGLAPKADQYNKIVISLSATEMRIATLIKNGMPSQSIADTLNISLETVKTHRKKIRKKLKLRNSDVNLTSYMKSLDD